MKLRKFKGVFRECFKEVSRVFNVYQKSSKEGFVVTVFTWHSLKLPEQKWGLCYLILSLMQ